MMFLSLGKVQVRVSLFILAQRTSEFLHEGLEEAPRGVFVGDEFSDLLGEGGDFFPLQAAGYDVFEPGQVVVTVQC